MSIGTMRVAVLVTVPAQNDFYSPQPMLAAKAVHAYDMKCTEAQAKTLADTIRQANPDAVLQITWTGETKL